MARQVTLEEAAGSLPELVREVRGGREIVLTEKHHPVVRLVPVGEAALTPSEMARLADVGGAFDWLADEPDLYDDTSGEAIR